MKWYYLMEQKLICEPVFDFRKNEKQRTFFYEVLKAIQGNSLNRYFFYGGAVRGGKTSVCLIIFIFLAKKYPNSRWHIIRDSFTTLEATTIPSLEKFCPEFSESVLKYNRNKSNYYVQFKNGSKIFVSSESVYTDPELTWMLGLETNGIFLEQMEGLQEKTFEKALERSGSWYIDPMPPALILGTFNPTHNWVKGKLFTPHIKGELKSPYYFLEALPSDNPMVTADQWEAWNSMSAVNYARYIQGNWDVIESNNAFMTQYDITKHESDKAVFRPNKQLRIIIDFNINPFAVNFAHLWKDEQGEHCHIFDEIDIHNGSIPALIDRIKEKYSPQLSNCLITGDAMGNKRSIEQRDNASHYILLQRGLNLRPAQIITPPNPTHENSRSDCNYVLFNFHDFKINPVNCPNTCRDMKIVQCDAFGSIVKSNRKDVAQQADHFDNIRYLINTFLFDWIKHHSKRRK